jgi:hypothetical protein
LRAGIWGFGLYFRKMLCLLIAHNYEKEREGDLFDNNLISIKFTVESTSEGGIFL